MKKIFLIFLLLIQFLVCSFSTAEPIVEARNYLDQNLAEKALETLTTLDENNLSAEAEFLLADAYQRTNQIDKSIKHAVNALQLDPKKSEYHMLFAESQGLKLASGDGGVFKKMGMVKRVRKSFEAAVYLDPSNLRAREGLTQFYLMAPGIAGGSKKKALLQAKAVFAIDKQRGYPLLANTYRSSKKLKQSKETLYNWQKEFPDDWNAVIGLAYSEVTEKNYNNAYDLFSSWLEKKPQDSAALYQLGRLAAISKEHLDVGEQSLLDYLKLPLEKNAPRYEHAHWRLAMVYQHKNELDKAKLHIDESLKIAPKNKNFIKFKNSL